ncbi:DNA repair protein rad52 [Elasticomyces elasticus]|uniref:DNA repair protein rad52 n=1 Tax=Exophiala sideris TaxID=1016849 RepID=A0ABR0J7Q1_9EURO|nr:DNA repair protein rad52 [Elasticomyces elasticus]KAK5029965.1 DNA repair protein rad52 [Exophiala sideris]KAK5031595.1 DNA repair protein rad52 [Exophiala sideris]KAK5058273.1 DNA repair protein rad52 [Exophiala sideris]KAK5180202.1 DNA repair protein rad52 [Eurotiomycetes sp. CCFEE 6388]
MPAVGDQHKLNGNSTANPFEDHKHFISEYTAQEIATLQSRLEKQLGPEYILTRAGPGGSKVPYLPGEKVISLANDVFGFNGWSSSIQNIQIDFVDENPQTGKVSLGLSVIIRVTLKDGTYHEDVGYGTAENVKGKAMAFEKAKKQGTTDALKRTLRNFGNVLGNCLYDKTYLANVTKMKSAPTKWDPNQLHRHHDFASKKPEEEVKRSLSAPAREASNEFDDTFDVDDFELEDFDAIEMAGPDELSLSAEPEDTARKPVNGAAERMPPPSRTNLTTPSKPPMPVPRPAATRSAPASAARPLPQPLPGQRVQALPAQSAKPLSVSDQRMPPVESSRPPSPHVPSEHFPQHPPGRNATTTGSSSRPTGFYSARVAENIDEHNNVTAAAAPTALKFNPHAESPSIRKTSGVDHNRSVPLKRDLKSDTSTVTTNVINPQFDQSRKVGAPSPNGLVGGIRGGTSSYRPPTRRGPETFGVTMQHPTDSGSEQNLQAARRIPLGDVSNMQHNVTAVTVDGADAKRQRVLDPDHEGGNGLVNEDKSNG